MRLWTVVELSERKRERERGEGRERTGGAHGVFRHHVEASVFTNFSLDSSLVSAFSGSPLSLSISRHEPKPIDWEPLITPKTVKPRNFRKKERGKREIERESRDWRRTVPFGERKGDCWSVIFFAFNLI